MESTEAEWVYSMKREMQEIIPGLFLGPYSAASKSKFNTLVENGITHIICIRQSVDAHIIKPNFPDYFKYFLIEMTDNYMQGLISQLIECRDFINDCLNSGGKCLIHGNLGVSRSAAIVIGYIMEQKSLTFKEAYNFVQNRRYCINPNDNFKNQLMEYEAIYKAQKTLLNGQCSQVQLRHKRKYELDAEDADGDSQEFMDEKV